MLANCLVRVIWLWWCDLLITIWPCVNVNLSLFSVLAYGLPRTLPDPGVALQPLWPSKSSLECSPTSCAGDDCDDDDSAWELDSPGGRHVKMVFLKKRRARTGGSPRCALWLHNFALVEVLHLVGLPFCSLQGWTCALPLCCLSVLCHSALIVFWFSWDRLGLALNMAIWTEQLLVIVPSD